MKRRQIIAGMMGMMAGSILPRWRGPDHSMGDSGTGQVLRGQVLRDGDAMPFDPISDREQPVALAVISDPVIADTTLSNTAVMDMDKRDSQTMSEPVTTASDTPPGASRDLNPLAATTATPATTTPTTSTATTLTATAAPPASTPVNSSMAEKNKAAKTARSVVAKNIDFARDYDDDIFVDEADLPLLHSVVLRLKNTQQTIGFGNFNLLSFDQALVYARRFGQIGEFTTAEKQFIERLFFTNAADYGFYGKKVTDQLTAAFKKSDTAKIPYSGHYLFNNDSLAYYEKLVRDMGESVILTSGIRSNVKQLYLFLAKTVRVNGNLSRASRSLAPPGYSYHGIGDFDVGKIGWGIRNFTDDFAGTDEYKRMQDLGYIAIRYDHGNQLGVRFEPWHIKVV